MTPDSLRAEGDAGAAGRTGVPANWRGGARLDVGASPDLGRNDDLDQIAIERQAACPEVDDGLQTSEGAAGGGVDQSDAFEVPAIAGALGAGAGQIIGLVGDGDPLDDLRQA